MSKKSCSDARSANGRAGPGRSEIIQTVERLSERVGVSVACQVGCTQSQLVSISSGCRTQTAITLKAEHLHSVSPTKRRLGRS